jgi:SAM-dependent methyltransferase
VCARFLVFLLSPAGEPIVDSLRAARRGAAPPRPARAIGTASSAAPAVPWRGPARKQQGVLAMSEAAAQFTGEIPRYYDRCLGPVMFEPYAADLVARIPMREGLRVLEIACGTGIVTRRLRAALPASASLVATDLNGAMLAYAAASQSADGVSWQVADAQALPFEDNSFDVVACQFGVMFLPDKPQGFMEARRVLALGGLLLANVWRALEENPYAQAAQALLARCYPHDPPRFFETPYGYHDPDRLRADLAAAGWDRVRLDDVRQEGTSASATEFADGFAYGSPVTHELVARGAQLDAFAADLAREFAALGGEAPCRTQLSATVITAQR